MLLKNAIDMIHQALPGLGAGSRPYSDAVRALERLSRHLPQGGPTAGVQATQLQDLLRNTVRNSILQKIMGSQGGGGGEPGDMPGGAPAAPMPSTPMPGA